MRAGPRERVQGRRQLIAGSKAVRGILREATGHDAIERRGDRRIASRRRLWGGLQNLRANGTDGSSIKGARAGQHLVQNNAERELIRAGVLGLALDLFRSQVRWRAQQPARTRNLRGVTRDAKVAKLYLVFRRHKNVSGLDIAVKNSGAVGYCQRIGQIGRPSAGALRRQRGRIEMVLQRFAGNVFHHQKRSALLVDAHVVKLHDGRIGKLADDLRLAQELLLLALAKAIDKSLEGDDSADDVVARHFNAAGSAGAERLDAFVAAFLQCNHQAERSNRAARSRKPCPLDGATGTGVSLRRASGYSSSARASAGA